MRFTHFRIQYGRGAPWPPALLSRGWALAAPAAAEIPWRPPCDLVESAGGWTVRLELAGVAEEDVEVSLYEDSLIVEGARPWPGVSAGDCVHLAELHHGAFRFALRLPGGVDRAATQARLERGLLTLVLPRARGGRP